jgi:multiple sugar transport system permease protein
MHKPLRVLSSVAYHLFASVLAAVVMVPFFWMIITSLKDKGAMLTVPVQWIPTSPNLLSFDKVIHLFRFDTALLNSGIVSVLATVITILSAAMAAYGFAKIEFRGREGLFRIYLATMMIPFQVVLIPLFLVMKELGLINSFAGLVIPSVFNAFAIFMLRQQMMTIPNDFIDAAVLDGAGQFKVFRMIILPLTTPTLITLGVITFMGTWNDYLWPLVMLSDRKKMTLPLVLNVLNGQYTSDYNVLMAGALISMAPILLLYLVAQKYFKSGLQVGGIKG